MTTIDIADRCICCAGSNLLSSPAILMPFVAHRTLGWAPVDIDDTWGLRDVPQGRAVSICNSLFCSDCNVCFLDIRFSDEQMSKLYMDYRGHSYVELRSRYEPGYGVRNQSLKVGRGYEDTVEQFLAPFINTPVKLLDWGGDTGINTPFKGQLDVFDIFDISELDTVPGARRVSEEEAGRNNYSLIVCSQVLEHVPWPHLTLERIANCMAPSTVLYLEVPLEDLVLKSAPLPFSKRHWHEHINFFSEESIFKLAKRVGMDVLRSNPSCNVHVEGRECTMLQFALRRISRPTDRC
jgi:hypothetical protein